MPSYWCNYWIHVYGIYLQGHMTGRSCPTVPPLYLLASSVLARISLCVTLLHPEIKTRFGSFTQDRRTYLNRKLWWTLDKRSHGFVNHTWLCWSLTWQPNSNLKSWVPISFQTHARIVLFELSERWPLPPCYLLVTSQFWWWYTHWYHDNRVNWNYQETILIYRYILNSVHLNYSSLS